MKKILFGLFAILAMTLTSCKDEAGLPGAGDPVNVAGEVAGVYTGTWSRTLNTEPDKPSTAEGTITLTQVDDEFYVVTVDSKCADLNVDLSAPANINPRKVFFNSTTTAYGNSFSGKVVDNAVSLDFTLTVKEGRKQYIYNYSFSGSK